MIRFREGVTTWLHCFADHPPTDVSAQPSTRRMITVLLLHHPCTAALFASCTSMGVGTYTWTYPCTVATQHLPSFILLMHLEKPSRPNPFSTCLFRRRTDHTLPHGLSRTAFDWEYQRRKRRLDPPEHDFRSHRSRLCFIDSRTDLRSLLHERLSRSHKADRRG